MRRSYLTRQAQQALSEAGEQRSSRWEAEGRQRERGGKQSRAEASSLIAALFVSETFKVLRQKSAVGRINAPSVKKKKTREERRRVELEFCWEKTARSPAQVSTSKSMQGSARVSVVHDHF